MKYDGDGNVEHFKGRLVVQGFSQKHGIDYDEKLFSRVARFSSICCILLAFAAKYKLLVHQMDAVRAFLNGKLNEEIYMQCHSHYNYYCSYLNVNLCWLRSGLFASLLWY